MSSAMPPRYWLASDLAMQRGAHAVAHAAASRAKTRIGLCAPSAPLTRGDADRVTAFAGEIQPGVELVFHPQCFAVAGHFAGSDAERLAGFVAMANDPAIDAVWFARGGYGACRIAEAAMLAVTPAARAKRYLGYSDGGNLLAALYRAGVGHPAHGPMAADIRREGGDAAVRRALAWLAQGDPTGAEPALVDGGYYAAFNLMTLTMLLGTPIAPELGGHVLLIEEVAEHDYAFDRAFFHLAMSLRGQGVAGIRLGRVSDVPINDRPFGHDAETIARHWCAAAEIPFLGTADIGHDAANRIVPFGRFAA